MRALQTSSITTSHPRVFLEQDPFQRLYCPNLKPSSHLSSPEDKFPFLLPFISLLLRLQIFRDRDGLPAGMCVPWLEQAGCGQG